MLEALPLEQARETREVAVVGVDRYGVDVLATIGSGTTTLRAGFPEPVRHGHDVVRALCGLFRCPCGGGRPSVGGYLRPEQAGIVDECRRTGVLNGEREAAAIVTLATLFGRRGGSICSVADNIVTGASFVAGAGHKATVEIALEGVAILDRMDQAAARAGSDVWLPSMGGIA